jgi:hypothetical protein
LQGGAQAHAEPRAAADEGGVAQGQGVLQSMECVVTMCEKCNKNI